MIDPTRTVPKSEKCVHGHVGYCGLCWADQAPKCKHGNPGACGFCIGERTKAKRGAGS